jgi:Fe-S-cluster-containing hydrogenase component 2
MKRKSTVLKERIDRLYRQRSLAQQLHATPLLRRCPKVFLEALKEVVELVSCEPDEVIAREGDEVDSLYLVRAGFVKQSKRLESGDVVVNYLSKGMSLGEVELLLGDTGGWTTTSRSVEYSELVRIRREHFVELLRQSPETERLLWSTAQERIRENGYSHRNLDHAEFLETALDDGLVQGNALLVIDLDSCTRCDDCVRACAETHGGRPRFVREGDRYGRLQVASACYHCRDPLCLVGCPTGAIRRAGIGEVVAVSEDICIGCGTCSRACPYDAIMMHDTGEIWPDIMVPEGLRGKPRLVASKCDLCHTRPQGPACVHNCPNGCAFRIGSLEEFKRLLRRR